jgi:hypothetical protein
MKIYKVMGLGAALVIAPLALAKLSFTNEAFGKVEGTLDFCAKADPQSAGQYQEHKKALVKEIPAKEVEEARASQNYKDAYAWVTDELGKVPKERAVETCGAFLQGK